MGVETTGGVTPDRIENCEPTIVTAWAEAIGTDRRLSVATRLARNAAKAERDAQRQIAKAMPCPPFGGCPRPCRRGGASFSGNTLNIDVAGPPAPGGDFRVTYKWTWSYRVTCRCPKR